MGVERHARCHHADPRVRKICLYLLLLWNGKKTDREIEQTDKIIFTMLLE